MSVIPALPAGTTVFERGWLSANNVLFIGRDSAALVDSGYYTHAEQTTALVRHALGSRPLKQLLNTHLHSDHCGGNAALQKGFAGLQTFVPPGLAKHVRDWDSAALSYLPTGQHCPEFRLDDVLQPGTAIQLADMSWQVHSAPGHDPHSVILFEPESRTLISADALWENGFGVVFQELEGERAFDEVAETLDLIESLGPRVVIPGHGRVFVDAPQALSRARARLDHFVKNPKKHAQHAAKVLLKFKLLEQQDIASLTLSEWAESTGYFRIVYDRYFSDQKMQEWIAQLMAELIQVGAARQVDGRILNVG
jgi:glyoxylase-like metal-dependent hydrolase (beta-lactamase superfamily II)